MVDGVPPLSSFSPSLSDVHSADASEAARNRRSIFHFQEGDPAQRASYYRSKSAPRGVGEIPSPAGGAEMQKPKGFRKREPAPYSMTLPPGGGSGLRRGGKGPGGATRGGEGGAQDGGGQSPPSFVRGKRTARSVFDQRKSALFAQRHRESELRSPRRRDSRCDEEENEGEGEGLPPRTMRRDPSSPLRSSGHRHRHRDSDGRAFAGRDILDDPHAPPIVELSMPTVGVVGRNDTSTSSLENEDESKDGSNANWSGWLGEDAGGGGPGYGTTKKEIDGARAPAEDGAAPAKGGGSRGEWEKLRCKSRILQKHTFASNDDSDNDEDAGGVDDPGTDDRGRGLSVSFSFGDRQTSEQLLHPPTMEKVRTGGRRGSSGGSGGSAPPVGRSTSGNNLLPPKGSQPTPHGSFLPGGGGVSSSRKAPHRPKPELSFDKSEASSSSDLVAKLELAKRRYARMSVRARMPPAAETEKRTHSATESLHSQDRVVEGDVLVPRGEEGERRGSDGRNRSGGGSESFDRPEDGAAATETTDDTASDVREADKEEGDQGADGARRSDSGVSAVDGLEEGEAAAQESGEAKISSSDGSQSRGLEEEDVDGGIGGDGSDVPRDEGATSPPPTEDEMLNLVGRLTDFDEDEGHGNTDDGEDVALVAEATMDDDAAPSTEAPEAQALEPDDHGGYDVVNNVISHSCDNADKYDVMGEETEEVEEEEDVIEPDERGVYDAGVGGSSSNLLTDGKNREGGGDIIEGGDSLKETDAKGGIDGSGELDEAALAAPSDEADPIGAKERNDEHPAQARDGEGATAAEDGAVSPNCTRKSVLRRITILAPGSEDDKQQQQTVIPKEEGGFKYEGLEYERTPEHSPEHSKATTRGKEGAAENPASNGSRHTSATSVMSGATSVNTSLAPSDATSSFLRGTKCPTPESMGSIGSTAFWRRESERSGTKISNGVEDNIELTDVMRERARWMSMTAVIPRASEGSYEEEEEGETDEFEVVLEAYEERLEDLARRSVGARVLTKKLFDGYCPPDNNAACQDCGMPLLQRTPSEPAECVVCSVLEVKLDDAIEALKQADTRYQTSIALDAEISQLSAEAEEKVRVAREADEAECSAKEKWPVVEEELAAAREIFEDARIDVLWHSKEFRKINIVSEKATEEARKIVNDAWAEKVKAQRQANDEAAKVEKVWLEAENRHLRTLRATAHSEMNLQFAEEAVRKAIFHRDRTAEELKNKQQDVIQAKSDVEIKVVEKFWASEGARTAVSVQEKKFESTKAVGEEAERKAKELHDAGRERLEGVEIVLAEAQETLAGVEANMDAIRTAAQEAAATKEAALHDGARLRGLIEKKKQELDQTMKELRNAVMKN